jgi:predicted RNA-binding Zn-ribbon protein involved in translation (DUF1610 family)
MTNVPTRDHTCFICNQKTVAVGERGTRFFCPRCGHNFSSSPREDIITYHTRKLNEDPVIERPSKIANEA